MTVQDHLNRLNLSLPEVSTPGGNYVSVNIRGNVAYVAIQFPIYNEEYRYQGILGSNLTTADGYKAMELCALNVLSQVNAKVGFNRVEGLNHIDIYYQSDNAWDDAPEVANGASDLFKKVLEDKGVHTRSIIGVHKLPRNFCVGLAASFTLLGE